MPRPRLVVVQNVPRGPIGRFGQWLDGIELDVVRPYAGDPVPRRATNGLIVLGGMMSPTDDHQVTWLPDVRRLLASSVAGAVPTLGICLGAQLLAVACGGRTEQSAAAGPELGVIDVKWRAAAIRDPLLAGLPDPFPAPSWHVDEISRLPPGAVWLGASTAYPHQAFRVGEAAWGLQFHPEVSLTDYRNWAGRSGEPGSAAAVASFDRRQGEVTVAARALAHRFADLCR